MKLWVAPLIITWAVGATAAAVFFAMNVPEAPKAAVSETTGPTPSDVEVYVDRSTRRLRRRVERLRQALSEMMPTVVVDGPEASEGIAVVETPSPAERVLTVLDESRRLDDSDTWTVDASRVLSREMGALVATDASTHLALMQRLSQAADEDESLDVLSWLVESPFAHMVRADSVTTAIRADARELLDDSRPHLRSAATRVLYAYDSALLDDVLDGIARLRTETDPTVRENLLSELTVAARELPLTIEQAQPMIDALRERSRTQGGGWAAAELAQWSVDESDLTHVVALLDAASDAYDAQDILNAFQRDTRLAGAHEETTRDVLLGVMADRSRNPMVRDLALRFLRGYAPWDAATADAARRYSAE